MSLEPGTHLGPYEIVASLGAGGMGEVYRAHESRLEREVAIKLLPRHLLGERRALVRFEREARAVSAISHPNIVTLYDVGTHDGMPYVVTELLEGESLSARLEREGRLPWEQVAEIGSGIARGLSAAHEKGIIHRDVKPGNVFLTRDGKVKLLDFGVARFDPDFAKLQGEQTSEQWTQTAAGHVIGTLAYMAPEQLNGGNIDARSDLFALGCVLYEMLAGRHPFEGASFVDTVMAVVREDPQPLATPELAMPADLERLVLECLAKLPAARPASTRVVADALEELLGSGSIHTAVPRPARDRRLSRRGVLAAFAALTLTSLSALGWWWLRSAERAAPVTARTVALLPLRSLTPGPDAGALERVLDGLLGAELARRGEVRLCPADQVGRVIRELGLSTGEGLGAGTLARMRELLGADYVVSGTYWTEGDPGIRNLRVDLWLQDTADGEIVGGCSEHGAEKELPGLVARLAGALSEGMKESER